MNTENSRCLLQFPKFIAGLEMSLCTKFQLDSAYSHKVLASHVIFDLCGLSDPRIQDGHAKMNRHHMGELYTRF